MKKWGQNFLKNKNIASNILNFAALTKDDLIFEIGPGLGILTSLMASRVDRIVAIEIDPRLVVYLRNKFQDVANVEIIQADILNYGLPPSFRKASFKVIANIPYYITTPILFKLLEWRKHYSNFKYAVLMVQKEVAERLAALPGSRKYGIISLKLQLYAEVEILCYIGAKNFQPRPLVDSAMIKINFLAKPRVNLSDEKIFNKIVEASFAQRRKTIFNSLKNNYGLAKEILWQSLKQSDIDPSRRAETLSIAEFAKLSEEIYEKQKLAP